MPSTLLHHLAKRQGWQTFGAFTAAFAETARRLRPHPRVDPPSETQMRRWYAGRIDRPHPLTCSVLVAMFAPYDIDELFTVCDGIRPPRAQPDVIVAATDPPPGQSGYTTGTAGYQALLPFTAAPAPRAPMTTSFTGPPPDQAEPAPFATAAYAGSIERVIFTALQTRQHASTAGASAVSDTTIEDLLTDIAAAARDYGSKAPGTAALAVLHLHDQARAHLDRTRRPLQQRDLYLALAQTSALMTSATSDLGLWATAEHYAAAAYDYADGIGHAGARAYVLGLQAMIAYWTGRPVEAVTFGQQAVEAAPAGLATVRANSLLARAWAHQGAADQVDAALRAARAASTVSGDDEQHSPTGGEFGWVAPQHQRSASTAWLQVNRPREASVAATRALELISVGRRSAGSALEAEVCADLAACHLLLGRPDAAHEALTPAITALGPLWSTPVDWRRAGVLTRVDRVAELLSSPRWRGVAEARNLLDLVRAFSATRPAIPAELTS